MVTMRMDHVICNFRIAVGCLNELPAYIITKFNLKSDISLVKLEMKITFVV